ncbi:hypothetical protein E4U41_001811 [Claviceps citrina]|nr:hypothetical protein E4U41_001811 [Claviceps citrina]
MALTTFSQFGRLPTEIRDLVWREFLAAYDQPTLYLYNKNFFLRHLDPKGEDERYAGMSHTPLVEVGSLPSLLVSSESRSATLRWARARGISLRWRAETRSHVLARAFDGARDVLYVSHDKWKEFRELSLESDGLEETTAQVRHLALPGSMVYYSYLNSFIEVGYYTGRFSGLRTLLSVRGALPELQYARTRRVVSRRRQDEDEDEEDDDDDGTDTGVDPATGEVEERIAAELQPRWVLEEETAEVVRIRGWDPLDGSETELRWPVEIWAVWVRRE